MKIFKPLFIIFLMLTFLLVSCVSDNNLNETSDPIENSEDEETDDPLAALSVSSDFNYSTTMEIDVELDVPDFLSNAVFNLYSKTGDTDSLKVGKATFDTSGHFEKSFIITARADSLLLFSEYLGLTSEVRLPIESDEIAFDFRPLYERSETSGKEKVQPQSLKYSFDDRDYTFIDTYDSSGVPENLVFPDVIQQNLLDDINTSLPESYPGGIPASNPDFLANGIDTQIVLDQEADVWVTFVAEGAGYRNTLGYYTYTLGEEPTSVDEITHNVIFPNSSMTGSGGGLIPGDRVFLGRFPENTVISWFIVANGWYGSGVGDGNGIYYSNADFNPESTEDNRRHMVLLYDKGRDLTLLGFEDLNRDGNSDDDFNDAVFYAKSNPPEAIQTTSLAEIQTSNDADGDGINDELDDFPFDADKAFNNYAPSENSSGMLAYEDLWPNQGDYDFNDLVLDYTFNLIANADNLVTTIEGSFTVEHIGASFHNGFAFVLPIDPAAVTSVDGQILNGGYETVNANGTEAGTNSDETVIIVVGDTYDLLGETIDITVTLNTPTDESDLGDVPFNAFLIANADRQREVHLPDLLPTSKAGYLATEDDYSDSGIGRYYKTDRNLPWALNLYESFTPPSESVPITLTYPRFVNWANSGGTEDLDWYIK